jgi:hypothetical protein
VAYKLGSFIRRFSIWAVKYFASMKSMALVILAPLVGRSLRWSRGQLCFAIGSLGHGLEGHSTGVLDDYE